MNNLESQLVYASTMIDQLSGYLKKYNNTKVSKSVFYELKYKFIKYLIYLCTKQTNDPYELLFKLNVNYKSKIDDKTIYNITFRLNNYIITFNVHDTDLYIEKTIPNINLVPEKLWDYNNYIEDPNLLLKEEDIYAVYHNFITWCADNHWFFVDFQNDYSAYDFMFKIYKDNDLYIFYDPFQSHVKLSMRTPFVYIFRYANGKWYFKYEKLSRLVFCLNSESFYQYTKLDENTDPFKNMYHKNDPTYTLNKWYTNHGRYGINVDNSVTVVDSHKCKKLINAKMHILNHLAKYYNKPDRYFIDKEKSK